MLYSDSESTHHAEPDQEFISDAPLNHLIFVNTFAPTTKKQRKRAKPDSDLEEMDELEDEESTTSQQSHRGKKLLKLSQPGKLSKKKKPALNAQAGVFTEARLDKILGIKDSDAEEPPVREITGCL